MAEEYLDCERGVNEMTRVLRELIPDISEAFL